MTPRAPADLPGRAINDYERTARIAGLDELIYTSQGSLAPWPEQE